MERLPHLSLPCTFLPLAISTTSIPIMRFTVLMEHWYTGKEAFVSLLGPGGTEQSFHFRSDPQLSTGWQGASGDSMPGPRSRSVLMIA